ncbi:MAG: MlaD family protein [Shimia sp.]
MANETEAAEMEIDESRRARPSLVWLVPLAALAIALWVGWRTYAEQGPLVTVTFAEAAGVRAGETPLRFRDIDVGLVESVSFSPDLLQVQADIRLDPDIAPFVDAGARFWIVAPEVTAQGVTGLETVLSGVYIEGAWDGEIGEDADVFAGLTDRPLLPPGTEGTLIELVSEVGLPTGGTPILLRGVVAGRVGEPRLSAAGDTAVAEAVIYAPYNRQLTTATRFWDASGFDVSIGTAGAEIDFSSIASLIGGGVEFGQIASGGRPITGGTTFELFEDQELASQNFFAESDEDAVDLTMVFAENLPGLAPGSAVELGGLEIGEVRTVQGIVDPERFGDDRVRLSVNVRVNPGRIGLPEEIDVLDFFEGRITADGLRARLTNGSIITGELIVELVPLEVVTPANLDRDGDPYPVFPTAASNVTSVTATAQGLLSRVDALPIEELLGAAIDVLSSSAALIGSEDLQAAPADLRATLGAVREVATSDDIAALPARLTALAEGLQTSVDGVAALVAQAEDGELIAATTRLLTALEGTAELLPSLTTRIDTLLAEVNELPLAELAARTEGILSEAETLLAADATQALPADIQAAVAEATATLAGLRVVVESEAVTTLPARAETVLAGIETSVTSLDAILAGIEAEGIVPATGTLLEETLPALSAQAEALLANAAALDLDALVTRTEGVLAQTEMLLASDAAQALPADAQAAIQALTETLAGVQTVIESEAVATLPERTDAILASVAESADSLNRLLATAEAEGIVAATGTLLDTTLPALADQASAILSDAEALELDQLIARVESFLLQAEVFLGDPDTQDLPEATVAVLDELRETLAALQDGGLIENANQTLLSAREAADAIALATEQLPAISRQLTEVATQAGDTLAGYDANSAIGRDLATALRQIETTAASFDRLARQIARNPSSLLTGR